MKIRHATRGYTRLTSIHGGPQPEPHVWQNMPPNLLGLIFSTLSTPGQVSFSLSCKHIYACFNDFLAARGIRLSHLVPRETPPAGCSQVILNQQLRTELLHQRENSRWKYCHCCQKLHPHSKWHVSRYIWPFSRSPHLSRRALPHRRHCCIAYAARSIFALASTLDFMIYIT